MASRRDLEAAEERERTGSARREVGSLVERMRVMEVEKAVGSLRLDLGFLVLRVEFVEDWEDPLSESRAELPP